MYHMMLQINNKGCKSIYCSTYLIHGDNSQYSSSSEMSIKMKPYVIAHILNGHEIGQDDLLKVAGLKYELYESRNTITRSTSLNKLKVSPLTAEEKNDLGFFSIGIYYIVDDTQDNTEIEISRNPDIYIYGLI